LPPTHLKLLAHLISVVEVEVDQEVSEELGVVDEEG